MNRFGLLRKAFRRGPYFIFINIRSSRRYGQKCEDLVAKLKANETKYKVHVKTLQDTKNIEVGHGR